MEVDFYENTLENDTQTKEKGLIDMDVINDALDPMMMKLEDMESMVKSLKVSLGNAEMKMGESNDNIFKL